MKNFRLSLIVVAASFFQPVLAQEAVPTEPVDEINPWTFGVDIGATASWSHNRRYVGIADGNYFGLGGKLGINADYELGMHEWRNSLSLLEVFNHMPTIQGWIKSADQLAFESSYIANFGRWWGYFATLKLNTSVFSGTDKRATDHQYAVTDPNNNKSTSTGRSLSLTTPFQPLYLQESTGLFARLLDYDYFTWKVYAGPAARQNFARNQRIINSVNNNIVNVTTLSNSYLLGPVLGTNFFGMTLDDRVSYDAGAEVLYAAFRFPNPGSHNFRDRLNVDIFSRLSFKFFPWMGLAWDLHAILAPDIVKEFQLQNNLLLTFSYKF